MISITLVSSPVHVCSYLEELRSQTAFVYPLSQLNTAVYSQLIQQGFRRSGDDVYVPHCPECNACIPARLAVSEFKANRSQQRCWKKNSQTKAVIKPPVFEQAHYDLYLRYQRSRHCGGDMAESSPEDYMNFLSSSWCDTLFVEFLINGQLVGVAVIDYLDNALSAVYTFFDPKFSDYGLGVYAVLWQIDYAKHQQKEFVYLGFWIKACQKMAYKSNYQPLQIFRDRQWQNYAKSAVT
jgi:arginyl-tRNA--protein-N-Asp/Glu arginylyltransferase